MNIAAGHVLAVACAALLVMGALAWGAAALWFKAARGRRMAWLLLWTLFGAGLLVLLAAGRAGTALLLGACGFAAMLLWWRSLKPSNERAWADEVARAATAVVQGEQVTLHDVRNFEWRSREEFDARWETRHYDLQALRTLDMITSYWRGPAIAHVLFSFGFADGEYLTFSVEIRRPRSERFNELGGFFRQFELSIVAADERDVIRLRTNVRREEVYLYRIRLPAAEIRALFEIYLEQLNELARHPRFYNTVTANCTTLVYRMVQRIVRGLPFSYRVLLPGYLPEYVYSIGGLDGRYPLAQLRTLGRIGERAHSADRSSDFSTAIRAGIPPLPDSP